MSISRTATGGFLVDDDGTGATGTPLTNAERQSLLDVVDAWRAAVTLTATGVQHNLSITVGGIEGDVIRLNNASDISITGIAAPTAPAKPGKVIILKSVGAGNVFIEHENGGSSAANRVINLATSAPTMLLAGKGEAVYFYDGSSSRYRMLRHDQGGFATVSFAAGNFDGVGAMTWTLTSGDRASGFWLRGNRMCYHFELATTTVGGTLGQYLEINNAEWGGFSTSGALVYRPLGVAIDNNTSVTGAYCVHLTATTLSIAKATGDWSASTNQTYVYGDIDFQVT